MLTKEQEFTVFDSKDNDITDSLTCDPDDRTDIAILDCGSHSCYFKNDKARQQRTNSGCKCLSHLPIDKQIAIRKKFKELKNQ